MDEQRRKHDRWEQEWKKELERLKVEDKKRKRKQQYEKKKFTRYQERSRALRDATGVHGFVSLHRPRLYGSGVSWWTALSA